MSDQEIALALQERTVQGKAVKQLRRDGFIPAVIHDHGKESKVVMAPSMQLLKAYQQAGKHHPLALTLGKQKYMAMIKDVDFEPKKQQLRHVVFNAVSQDQKVEAEVPIHIEGDIPAEKAGLMVITQLDSVLVEALPKDLPDSLTVSPAALVEIGDKITVADITAPAGVTILTEPEHPIAAVEETKEQISEAAEEVEEGAEGETTEAAQESSEEE